MKTQIGKSTQQKTILLSTFFSLAAGMVFIVNSNNNSEVFLSKNSVLNMDNIKEFSADISITPRRNYWRLIHGDFAFHNTESDVDLINEIKFDPYIQSNELKKF